MIKNILLIIFLLQMITTAQRKEIVAYYSGGDLYHSYYVKNIKTSGAAEKITTLIYAFAVPDSDSTGHITLKINPYIDYQQIYTPEMSVDGTGDDTAQALRGQFNQLKKLKEEYPNLKVLISIGGWGGGKYFSDAALTPESREEFVDDCINKFIYGNLPVIGGAGGKGAAAGVFDGFDIDWEFPVSGGPEGTHNKPEDKENLTKLLALFREKLDEINPHLLLTEAIAADKPNLNNYDVKSEAKYLNWFNLMTYDFHGSWNKVTAHHTNLLSSPQDTTDDGARLSFDKSVRYFLDSLGIESKKIIPGAAFYGKCWFDVDSAEGGLYQPGKDSSGVFNGGYSDYASLIKMDTAGYTYYWDRLAMAPWLYNPAKKIFWTFDDTKSIALKARYADAYNLGGLMFWEISGDDSIGTLVNTIYTRNMPDIKNYKLVQEDAKSFITILKPKAGDIISAGSNVIIEANNPVNDKIIKVEFFVDGSSIGYTTLAPFDWVWFNASVGEHEINAVATDNSGKEYTSKKVLLIVN